MIQETGEGIGRFLLRLADGSPHSLHSWRVVHRAGTVDGGKDGCHCPCFPFTYTRMRRYQTQTCTHAKKIEHKTKHNDEVLPLVQYRYTNNTYMYVCRG